MPSDMFGLENKIKCVLDKNKWHSGIINGHECLETGAGAGCAQPWACHYEMDTCTGG